MTEPTTAAAGTDFRKVVFPYRRARDHGAEPPARHPVAVVGAGPVGLALAIDLALQGVPVVVLDDDDRLSTGSRAICFAKRTLEIFDRLGCGEAVAAKGVSWNVGKVFFRDAEIYRFDLLPEAGHARPAFVNLQQYYVEGYLAERAAALPLIDLRWKSAVVGVEPRADAVRLAIDTPDGRGAIDAAYVVACDGARSPLRRLAGLESRGRSFRDRFLIADIRLAPDHPGHRGRRLAAERWFWFDPPFHRGRSEQGDDAPPTSVLLHRQPDDVWRIDFQLGWDADPEVEKRPENIVPRVRALLGDDAQFELEWASVYTFACTRMARFRHGRLLFAGDAAHGVSPFGARGANSGVQDADNLAWKLAAVLQGRAGDALLDSYASEREFAADENIRHSSRATDFITPKSAASRLFREAVLTLAKTYPFARTLVNSGRLSTPAVLHASPLNTAAADKPADAAADKPSDAAADEPADAAAAAGPMPPGTAAADAPVGLPDGRTGWLLHQTRSGRFTALLFGNAAAARDASDVADLLWEADGIAALDVLRLVPAAGAASAVDGATTLVDTEGLAARRYDGRAGSVVLLRPDQHVCARFRTIDAAAVAQALRRALALV